MERLTRQVIKCLVSGIILVNINHCCASASEDPTKQAWDEAELEKRRLVAIKNKEENDVAVKKLNEYKMEKQVEELWANIEHEARTLSQRIISRLAKETNSIEPIIQLCALEKVLRSSFVYTGQIPENHYSEYVGGKPFIWEESELHKNYPEMSEKGYLALFKVANTKIWHLETVIKSMAKNPGDPELGAILQTFLGFETIDDLCRTMDRSFKDEVLYKVLPDDQKPGGYWTGSVGALFGQKESGMTDAKCKKALNILGFGNRGEPKQMDPYQEFKAEDEIVYLRKRLCQLYHLPTEEKNTGIFSSNDDGGVAKEQIQVMINIADRSRQKEDSIDASKKMIQAMLIDRHLNFASLVNNKIKEYKEKFLSLKSSILERRYKAALSRVVKRDLAVLMLFRDLNGLLPRDLR